jgi:predicted nicotinamide N-methyase
MKEEVLTSHTSCTKVCAATLYWGRDEAKYLEEYPNKFEVIMGGDLIYSREVIQPLLKCIRSLLDDQGVFFMIYVDRAGTGLGPDFLKAAAEAPYSMTHTVEQLEVKVDEANTYLYQLRKQ